MQFEAQYDLESEWNYILLPVLASCFTYIEESMSWKAISSASQAAQFGKGKVYQETEWDKKTSSWIFCFYLCTCCSSQTWTKMENVSQEQPKDAADIPSLSRYEFFSSITIFLLILGASDFPWSVCI